MLLERVLCMCTLLLRALVVWKKKKKKNVLFSWTLPFVSSSRVFKIFARLLSVAMKAKERVRLGCLVCLCCYVLWFLKPQKVVDGKGLASALGTLDRMLKDKNNHFIQPPTKKDLRFESVSRTKFLSRMKKPKRMWLKKSHELMKELDSVAERGIWYKILVYFCKSLNLSLLFALWKPFLPLIGLVQL
jgi:hypothetical protein